MHKKREIVNEEFYEQFGREDGWQRCRNGATCVLHLLARMRRNGKLLSVDELIDFLSLIPRFRKCHRCNVFESAFGTCGPSDKRTHTTPASVRLGGSGRRWVDKGLHEVAEHR